MQYCSLQHHTLLPTPVTSTMVCCFSLVPSLHSFWSYFSTDLQLHIILGTYIDLRNSSFTVLYLSLLSSPSEGRQTENHNHRKLTNLIPWTTALSSSMKLRAMPCRATQDGRVMVESSDKMWSTGEGNGKPLQYSCLENPMSGMKTKTDGTLKEELPRSVGAQYATGDQWRNNSRKNEETEPKQKQHPVVDVMGDGSKV